jgi:hypothetical protein
MGFFGTFEFTKSGWSKPDPGTGPSSADFHLWLDIHDSDFATVAYAPAEPGTGVAFVGYTPRVYFDIEDASEPTDPSREALGLATWTTTLDPNIDVASKRATIATFLASDEPPTEDRDLDDDAEAFVEIKVSRLLVELGVPLPDELAELAD